MESRPTSNQRLVEWIKVADAGMLSPQITLRTCRRFARYGVDAAAVRNWRQALARVSGAVSRRRAPGPRSAAGPPRKRRRRVIACHGAAEGSRFPDPMAPPRAQNRKRKLPTPRKAHVPSGAAEMIRSPCPVCSRAISSSQFQHGSAIEAVRRGRIRNRGNTRWPRVFRPCRRHIPPTRASQRTGLAKAPCPEFPRSPSRDPGRPARDRPAEAAPSGRRRLPRDRPAEARDRAPKRDDGPGPAEWAAPAGGGRRG